MKKTNRLLTSILLVFVMIVTILPVSVLDAYAATPTETATAATGDIRLDFTTGLDGFGTCVRVKNNAQQLLSGLKSENGCATFTSNAANTQQAVVYTDLPYIVDTNVHKYATIRFKPSNLDDAKFIRLFGYYYPDTSSANSKVFGNTKNKQKNDGTSDWGIPDSEGFYTIKVTINDELDGQNTIINNLMFQFASTADQGLAGTMTIDYITLSTTNENDFVEGITLKDGDGEVTYEIPEFSTDTEYYTAELPRLIYDNLKEGNTSAIALTATEGTTVTGLNVSALGDGKLAEIKVTNNNISRTYRVLLYTTSAPEYKPDIRFDFTSNTEGFAINDISAGTVEHRVNGDIRLNTNNEVKNPGLVKKELSINLYDYRYVHFKISETTKTGRVILYFYNNDNPRTYKMYDVEDVNVATGGSGQTYTINLNDCSESSTDTSDMYGKVYNQIVFTYLDTSRTPGHLDLDWLVMSQKPLSEIAPFSKIESHVTDGTKKIAGFTVGHKVYAGLYREDERQNVTDEDTVRAMVVLASYAGDELETVKVKYVDFEPGKDNFIINDSDLSIVTTDKTTIVKTFVWENGTFTPLCEFGIAGR